MFGFGSTSDSYPWHSSDQLFRAVRDFHEVKARSPREKLKQDKAVLTPIILCLERQLQGTGRYKRLEFTGSTYEGVNIGPENEFDIMVIKAGPYVSEEKLGNSGYAYLKAKANDKEYNQVMSDDGRISPEKMARFFLGDLQKCINDLGLFKTVKLRRHGPAVQMDVTEKGRNFSVDMVLTIELYSLWGLRCGAQYIAKPDDNNWDTWRFSTSLKEKEALNTMHDNGCQKQCLRILKAIRQQETSFMWLTSFHLKNILLHECHAQTDWYQKRLGQRVIDLLGRLERALGTRKLPHFFNPEINLLANVSSVPQDNLRNRIRHLLKNEAAFLRLVEVDRVELEAAQREIDSESGWCTIS